MLEKTNKAVVAYRKKSVKVYTEQGPNKTNSKIYWNSHRTCLLDKIKVRKKKKKRERTFFILVETSVH